jgi:hypothetical protein
MVTKDDVMKLHAQIVAMKQSQERMKKLASAFNNEIERVDSIIETIETIEKDYQELKKKADTE